MAEEYFADGVDMEFVAMITNENGHLIENDVGVLCQMLDKGEEKLLHINRDVLVANGLLETTETDVDEPSKPSPSSPADKTDSEWGSSDTKLLLDKYHTYMDNIGPLKKFKNKKCMWAQISMDILNIISVKRTPSQCENRYKTVMKRKTKVTEKNRTSGSTREQFEYQTEVDNIKAKDDSLEPEVLRGVGQSKITYKRVLNPPHHQQQQSNKEKKNTIIDTIKELHEEKERNKNKRHQEKLALIKELFGKKEEG